MEFEVLKAEKNDIELRMNNLTLAKILRVYLYREGVDFAAWKKEHPSKPAVMKITHHSGAKKIIKDAISSIKKECNKIVSAVKK